MLDKKVTSVEHLKEVLAATWESIPRELCMKLIESMPKRVKMCYLAKGGYYKRLRYLRFLDILLILN